jgi:hypothetical protein
MLQNALLTLGSHPYLNEYDVPAKKQHTSAVVRYNLQPRLYPIRGQQEISRLNRNIPIL